MTTEVPPAITYDRIVELYLVRHAHAGNAARWQGDDDARPLSAKGRLQAERLGALLAGAGVRLDSLLSSPMLRAMQTAEVLAEALHASVLEDERLGQGPTLQDLATIVTEAGVADRLMLVGHDPGFSDIATDLAGVPISMRKGSLLRIDLEARLVAPGTGLVRWLIPPDALGA